VGAEDSTAAEAEDFMEVVADHFTAEAEGFMEVVADHFTAGAEGFTGVEVSTPEATLGTADTTTADIVAATMEDGATTEVAAVTAGATAGAEDIGAEDTVTDGDGGLASSGRIGAGDIRMATTTARGITRPTLIILTLTIRILTTGTTILHGQILTHRPSPPRKFPSNPGAPRHREKT